MDIISLEEIQMMRERYSPGNNDPGDGRVIRLLDAYEAVMAVLESERATIEFFADEPDNGKAIDEGRMCRKLADLLPASGEGGANCRVPPRHERPPNESICKQALPGATNEEAYNQGGWAYAFGVPRKLNPYPEVDLHDAWDKSWGHGLENDEG